MSETREDLRVVRTKKLLTNALIGMLEEKPFDKVTVNDICETAMVHRATFYNHFKDKIDLLYYVFDGIQEDLFNKSIENCSYTCARDMYLTVISKTIDFMVENKKAILLILENCTPDMYTIINTTIKRSLKYIISKNKHESAFPIPVDVVVGFYTGGIAIVGLEWLQSKNQCSKEELLHYFDVLLFSNKMVDM